MKSILLIPVYRPDELFIKTLQDLSENENTSKCKIIVVNDGESPESNFFFHPILNDLDVTLLHHSKNLGKGAAIKTGFNYILKHFPSAENVVTLDADNQHSAADVESVCLHTHKADHLIIGTRDQKFSDSPLRSYFGNALTRIIFFLAAGKYIKDTQSGLRSFPLSLLEKLIRIKGDRYEYEMEVLFYLVSIKFPISFVSIQNLYFDDNSSSHFNPLIDSIKIYFVFFRHVLSSLFAAVTDASIFYLLHSTGFSLFTAHFFSRTVGGSANFFINFKYVFKSQAKIVPSGMKYALLMYTSGYLTYLLMLFLINRYSLGITESKIFAEFILFFFNFYAQYHLMRKNHGLAK